jgi:hypothetical protein
VVTVAVVAVAAPAGQALEGGLGGLPVAAAAGRLPAGLGAQQPVDLVPLATGYRRPLPAVASAIAPYSPDLGVMLPYSPLHLPAHGIRVNAVSPGWTATDMGGSGGRPVAEGAASIVWGVTLPDDGPTGGFFQDGQPLA